MEQYRIALVGIVVEDPESADKINSTLHHYAQYIVGRMGVPYKSRGVSVISIVIDAPGNVISALSGKLGMIQGCNAKTVYSNVTFDEEVKCQ
ncbi:MAG: iron-only hydrogenase system regulator [Clostridiales Family XIII bacterium]|jgi:putative iron-only hydrogenase system regulator|nr:iron-only hydrogenase system regulator [Clostridiales Family XIII bacterium]